MMSTVATIHITSNEEGWSLTTQQLSQQQEADVTLALMRGWLAVGRRPEWTEVSVLGPEVKVYQSQWGNFELHDGVMHQRW